MRFCPTCGRDFAAPQTPGPAWHRSTAPPRHETSPPMGTPPRPRLVPGRVGPGPPVGWDAAVVPSGERGRVEELLGVIAGAARFDDLWAEPYADLLDGAGAYKGARIVAGRGRFFRSTLIARPDRLLGLHTTDGRPLAVWYARMLDAAIARARWEHFCSLGHLRTVCPYQSAPHEAQLARLAEAQRLRSALVAGVGLPEAAARLGCPPGSILAGLVTELAAPL